MPPRAAKPDFITCSHASQQQGLVEDLLLVAVDRSKFTPLVVNTLTWAFRHLDCGVTMAETSCDPASAHQSVPEARDGQHHPLSEVANSIHCRITRI